MTNPDLPVHFIAGAEDPCIISLKKFSEAVSFLRSRGYREVTSQVYPRMRHEILNEIGREDVWRDVRERLDGWLARHPEARIDYIHGEAALRGLVGGRPDAMGFMPRPFDKGELFGYIRKFGVLPRKTFSMGEASEKRFYLEARRIVPGF